MATFKTTDQMLNRAKCSGHEAYDPTCVTCVHRYYQFLLSDDYTATWRFERLEAELRSAQASARSYKVEVESMRTELGILRETFDVIEEALSARGEL